MRPVIAAVLLACAGAGTLLAQPLTCPAVSPAAAHPCDTFHYHVQMYRPDTRAFVELYGINQFASQAACDRARDAQFRRSMAVVEFYRSHGDQQYPADKIGPCHCDMTIERTSPNFLGDLQRIGQLRQAEEIRQRVRERLLDRQVLSDSDLVRVPAQTFHPLVAGPRIVALPQRAAAAEVTRSQDELKMTKAIDPSATATASLDLPLADVPIDSQPAPPPATAPTTAVAAAPSNLPVEDVPADDAAEAFVSYETQRIQNVIQASNGITDEALKSKVLEACMQRIQLLSNLRSLIEGSGAKSRLATAARSARSEQDRLGLVAKLFGSDVPSHWAPKEAKDVIVDTSDIDAERVLRDSSGKVTDAQKRRALYAILARTQPTEEQQLWLTTVVEALLQ